MPKAKTEAPPKSAAEEATEDADLEFFEQWGSLGPGRQVEVSREPGRVYLSTLPLDADFSPGLIQDRWGGGEFSMRARGNGKFLKGMPTKFLTIEGEPITPKLPKVIEDTPEVMELRKKLAELTGDNEPKPAAVADNVMVAVVGMMAPVLTAIVTAAMDRPKQASPVEILDLARKLSKDAREAAPNPGGDFDPIERLGLPLLHEITEMRKLEAGKASENGTKEATPEAPSPTTTEPEASPVARVPSTMQELADFIAHWCAPHVARGGNPGLRAECLLEDLALQNPPLLAQVVNLANLENVLDHWAKMVPAVAAAREWHGEFISEVRRLADEPTAGVDVDDDSEGGRGDAGDGGDDGTPSKEGGEG